MVDGSEIWRNRLGWGIYLFTVVGVGFLPSLESFTAPDLRMVGDFLGIRNPWDSSAFFRKHLGNRFFSQPPNKPKFTNYQTIAMMVDLALWAMTVWPDILVEALLYCILSSDRSRLQDRDEICYGAYVREVFFSVSFTNAIMTLKANISMLH